MTPPQKVLDEFEFLKNFPKITGMDASIPSIPILNGTGTGTVRNRNSGRFLVDMLHFLTSERSKPKLTHDGYIYTYKSQKTDGDITWWCERNTKQHWDMQISGINFHRINFHRINCLRVSCLRVSYLRLSCHLPWLVLQAPPCVARSATRPALSART